MTATRESQPPRCALLAVADPVLRRLCHETLDSAGFVVTNDIDNGAAAVAAAREQRPEVIFLSRQLSDVPVLQVVKWLRSNTELAITPIIILGGSASLDYRANCRQITILSRPITTAHIQYALAKALSDNVKKR